MKTRSIYRQVTGQLDALKSIPLFIIRLVLAYGFYGPATMKLGNIQSIADWFGSMGFPFPLLNAYLATVTESLGVVLLLLGLGTRIISIPLMVTMLVAIFAVHFPNGFAADDNGFEIPLYYLVMLFTLLIYGGGKISVDQLIAKKMNG
ncbi:MAG: DoxX family protein [Mangrovibacterium sp.]